MPTHLKDELFVRALDIDDDEAEEVALPDELLDDDDLADTDDDPLEVDDGLGDEDEEESDFDEEE